MVQLACCQKLLGRGEGVGPKGQNACTEIYIHHLGLPFNRAIHIALQLQAGSLRSLHKAASTSTVELVGSYVALLVLIIVMDLLPEKACPLTA
ncbi:hypothetical protein Celaphus_00015140 [Cervus elaphus hippelaphus]|uniref:Uncharacterized protein n=1 Tax=Cervus elaphus hippelaphus TaxID=46360 RepID=A0A212CSW7_CEREH|nr:hypothetical protein Celaphus_00015140 [Cervus elaphus hippelaphus]